MRRLIEGRSGAAGPMSVIIAGPPGTGKTTLAYLVASAGGRAFVNLSAVSAGVKEVRAVMEDAGRARELGQGPTVLFLDEIHRFTKAQQDALLPGVEDRLVNPGRGDHPKPVVQRHRATAEQVDAGHPRAADR